MSAETGIAPHVLEDTDWHYIEAIVAHLQARAKAMSGSDEPDIDWDDTHGE